MYTHFIGRIGRDGAKVVNGKKGKFLSMDVATDAFSWGENKTLWIRIRSNRENHVKLAEYLTKGRLLLIEGSLQEPTIWTDKNGTAHAQLSLVADSINFVNNGKRKENQEAATPAVATEEVETKEGNPVPEKAPFEAPEDKEGDLPF